MARIHDLDPVAIAQTLVNLVYASYQLRHKNLRGTLRYVRFAPGEEPPEYEFIRDVLEGKTREIVAKWFGDGPMWGPPQLTLNVDIEKEAAE